MQWVTSKGNADTAGKGYTLRGLSEKQVSPFAGCPRAPPPAPLTGGHHLRPREAGSHAGALSAAGEERIAKRAKASDRESTSDSEADLSIVAAAVEAEAKAATQDPVSASEAGQPVSPAPAQTGKLLGKKRTAEEAGIAAVPAASPPDRAALATAAPRPSLMGDDIVRAAPDPEREKFNKARECIISALEEKRRVDPAKVIELVGLRCYFTYRLAGINATVASAMAASAVYPGAAATKPRRIQEAAMHFAEQLKLRERKKPKQGPNSQAARSLFSNGEGRLAALKGLSELKQDAYVTPQKLWSWHKTSEGKERPFSLSTAKRYMTRLGYILVNPKKQLYMDGRQQLSVQEELRSYIGEWDDVYRYMPRFSDDDEATLHEPSMLEEGKKYVHVTQDESTIYTNEVRRWVWAYMGRTKRMASKSSGQSLMISAFMCPCHGLLILNDEQATANPAVKRDAGLVILEPGANREGSWDGNMTLKQMKDVFAVFTILHAGSVAFFTFDNSSGHLKYADDAITLSKFTLRDAIFPKLKGGKEPSSEGASKEGASNEESKGKEGADKKGEGKKGEGKKGPNNRGGNTSGGNKKEGSKKGGTKKGRKKAYTSAQDDQEAKAEAIRRRMLEIDDDDVELAEAQ